LVSIEQLFFFLPNIFVSLFFAQCS